MKHKDSTYFQWKLLTHPKTYTGYAFRFKYPSLFFEMSGSPLTADSKNKLKAWFTTQDITLKKSANKIEAGMNKINSDWSSSLELFLAYLNQFQILSGLGVYEKPKVIAMQDSTAKLAMPIALKCHQNSIELIFWLITIFSSYAQKNDEPSLNSTVQNMLKKLQSNGLKGSNRGKFIEASLALDFPFVELNHQILHIGYGKRSFWLDGSFTNNTSVISSKIAKNKQLTAQFLKNVGIPVPKNVLAFNERHAIQIAQTLGYPVVIKPLDLDGGIGVKANLINKVEVLNAFREASKFSKNILVEQHVYGKDYRITVLNGQAIWAVERVPAGVTGDGKHSIIDLVNSQNQDVKRGNDSLTPLYKIFLDDDAFNQLSKQNMDASSIPKNGEFIRLRSTANITNGGTPVVVFKEMHEDNKQLAIQAAQALRLDLAGIDLLIPDISQSWLTTGAAICEVNAQPNIGQITTTRLYPHILSRLIKGSGRIPIILVLGKQDNFLSQKLKNTLIENNFSVGHFDGEAVYLNKTPITQQGTAPFIAGQSLITNTHVDAIIFDVISEELLQTGVPFPCYDILLIAGTELTDKKMNSIEHAEQLKCFSQLCHLLMDSCDGKIIILDDIDLKLSRTKPILKTVTISPIDIVDFVIDKFLSLEKTHSNSPHY